jgi:hypothetical protein
MKLTPFDLRRALELGIAFTADCKKLTLEGVDHKRQILTWSSNIKTDFDGRDLDRMYTDTRIHLCAYENRQFIRIYCHEGAHGPGDLIFSETQIEALKLVHVIEAEIRYQELTVTRVIDHPSFTISKD